MKFHYHQIKIFTFSPIFEAPQKIDNKLAHQINACEFIEALTLNIIEKWKQKR